MARVPDLMEFCHEHGLKLVTVADLIEYRRRHERLVERAIAVRLPTAYGEFTAVLFKETLTGKQHVALVRGDVDGKAGRARARAFGMSHRRRVPVAALRLRRTT